MGLGEMYSGISPPGGEELLRGIEWVRREMLMTRPTEGAQPSTYRDPQGRRRRLHFCLSSLEGTRDSEIRRGASQAPPLCRQNSYVGELGCRGTAVGAAEVAASRSLSTRGGRDGCSRDDPRAKRRAWCAPQGLARSRAGKHRETAHRLGSRRARQSDAHGAAHAHLTLRFDQVYAGAVEWSPLMDDAQVMLMETHRSRGLVSAQQDDGEGEGQEGDGVSHGLRRKTGRWSWWMRARRTQPVQWIVVNGRGCSSTRIPRLYGPLYFCPL